MTDIDVCEILIELRYYVEDLPHYTSEEVFKALTHSIEVLLKKKEGEGK